MALPRVSSTTVVTFMRMRCRRRHSHIHRITVVAGRGHIEQAAHDSHRTGGTCANTTSGCKTLHEVTGSSTQAAPLHRSHTANRRERRGVHANTVQTAVRGRHHTGPRKSQPTSAYTNGVSTTRVGRMHEPFAHSMATHYHTNMHITQNNAHTSHTNTITHVHDHKLQRHNTPIDAATTNVHDGGAPTINNDAVLQ